MNLTQFKRNPDKTSFHLKFSDGFEAEVTAKKLRDNCPCAECSGEEVLMHKYRPQGKKEITDEGYDLENAEPVGYYAIRLYWKDGHNSGIYTWEHLKELCKMT